MPFVSHLFVFLEVLQNELLVEDIHSVIKRKAAAFNLASRRSLAIFYIYPFGYFAENRERRTETKSSSV
jgi:hypothetical protein